MINRKKLLLFTILFHFGIILVLSGCSSSSLSSTDKKQSVNSTSSSADSGSLVTETYPITGLT